MWRVWQRAGGRPRLFGIPLPWTGAGPVGLALGSGGIGGMAHIGVLKVLEQAGLRPAALAGSSMGAVIASLYASGWTPHAMEELVASLDVPDLYDNRVSARTLALAGLSLLVQRLRSHPPERPRPLGLVRGRRIEENLRSWLGERRFSDLPLPLAVVATDLRTGDRAVFGPPSLKARLAKGGQAAVYLGDQPVWLAVRASIAVPGVFEPVHLQGRTLVDGGLVDAVPDALLGPLGASLRVAVSLELVPETAADPPDIPQLLGRAIDLMSLTITRLRRTAHVVIRPDTGDAGLIDLQRAPECIRKGEEAARRMLPTLLALAGRGGEAARARAAGS